MCEVITTVFALVLLLSLLHQVGRYRARRRAARWLRNIDGGRRR